MKQQGKIWMPDSFEEGEEIIKRLFPQQEETRSDGYSNDWGEGVWRLISTERQRFYNETFQENLYARRDLKIERCSCPCEEHDEVEKYILRVRQPKSQEGWKSKFPEYTPREREEKMKEINEEFEGEENSLARAMLLLYSVEPDYKELPLFERGRSSQYRTKNNESPSNRERGVLRGSKDYSFHTKGMEKGWKYLAEKFGDLTS
ncbi:hypothetical protein HN832_02690 [archaeon]|jgi:hypothetical protein|nr:hypothetical protein [archaeon]MBT4373262.1 hypothetical protein [archaeon]MBT4531607.1 hypothetical protein [archaeon]MBT7001215.1 hypothetical protein [archaeon]MBT7282299.1 hypothetical protein [archaeon]